MQHLVPKLPAQAQLVALGHGQVVGEETDDFALDIFEPVVGEGSEHRDLAGEQPHLQLEDGTVAGSLAVLANENLRGRRDRWSRPDGGRHSDTIPRPERAYSKTG